MMWGWSPQAQSILLPCEHLAFKWPNSGLSKLPAAWIANSSTASPKITDEEMISAKMQPGGRLAVILMQAGYHITAL